MVEICLIGKSCKTLMGLSLRKLSLSSLMQYLNYGRTLILLKLPHASIMPYQLLCQHIIHIQLSFVFLDIEDSKFGRHVLQAGEGDAQVFQNTIAEIINQSVDE